VRTTALVERIVLAGASGIHDNLLPIPAKQPKA
jgi:hypothetical protein